MSSDARWERATSDTLCGYCRLHIPEDAPIHVTTLVGVDRKRIRCQLCAGPAPPDLPDHLPRTTLPATKSKSKSTMTKLADVDDAREWLPYSEK